MAKRQAWDPDKAQRILDAALQEFAKAGYYKASTQTIADQAAVSKGTVFRYFDNKETLYFKTIDMAIARLKGVADFKVWTDSADLVSMILRATQYKTVLSKQYPAEFALLLAAYRADATIPKKLAKAATAIFDKWQAQNVAELVDPIVARLHLRQDIAKPVLEKFVQLYVQQMMAYTQDYMMHHPEIKTMADMGPIVSEIKQFMDMMEHGIVGPESN
ncbi:MAG: TetR/AcrR family transcriptional regulator [Lactobacillus sp.]|jgi:AcrR family transcriptional regulator|nr:TetR/AcrR family transcriptional regulator [Lactobacillus sp.]